MDPWYKTVTPRREVREGRSFNPDEFAIHLEQVIAKTAPADYRNPEQCFARTCLTRALREHAGMVLRRRAGRTTDTVPIMTLIAQFGGGKTHNLAALYHLATGGGVGRCPEVADRLREAGVPALPEARVAAFAGNAWDPREGGRRRGSTSPGSSPGSRAWVRPAPPRRPRPQAPMRLVASSGRPAPQDSEPESAPPSSAASTRTIRVSGDFPPEVWNRLGRTLLPKLRGGAALTLGVEF